MPASDFSAQEYARRIAKTNHAVIVSVDYRLAPEFPFPAPVFDCYDATCWAAENAKEFGADPGRLVVMGSLEAPLALDYNEVMLNNWELIGQFMYDRQAYPALLATGDLVRIEVEMSLGQADLALYLPGVEGYRRGRKSGARRTAA